MMNSTPKNLNSFSYDEPTHRRSLNLAQAKKKIMDFLARRNRSEYELRTKLEKICQPAVIEETLTWAKLQTWFPKAENLTAAVNENLSQRGKSIVAINKTLSSKGLPPIESSSADEFSKAKKLVLAKWSTVNFNGLNFTESQNLKTKIVRFVVSRGFELDIAQALLKNELQAGALSHDQE